MGHSPRPHVNPVLQPCSPGVSRHCPLPLTPPPPATAPWPLQGVDPCMSLLLGVAVVHHSVVTLEDSWDPQGWAPGPWGPSACRWRWRRDCGVGLKCWRRSSYR